MTGICPYACGFIPQELTCALNEKRDEGLPWWRRLFHCLRGDYFCVTEGTLPCPVMSKCDRELSKEGDMEKDTHGVEGEGWIGFDLDGTLAKYDKWEGIDHIGAPVGPMVERIKKLHEEGRKVKILTARVAPHKLEDGTVGESYITVPDGEGGATKQYASQYIRDWCHFNLGFVPEITHEKDHLMIDLYDDRCHQVVPNTGEVVEEQRNRWRALAVSERAYSKSIAVKLLAANVPSMAFLASGLWCLKADHPVCAGWLLAFSILTHAWISKEERRDD